MKTNSFLFIPTKPRFFSCPEYWSYKQQLKRVYDMRTRAIYHFTELCKKGWNCFFVTLTFNDKYLPKFEYLPSYLKDLTELPKDDSFIRCNCFDTNIINKFCRDIRNFLNQHFGISTFHYMIVGEYGKNTDRPHYHAILAFPPSAYWHTGVKRNKKMEFVKTDKLVYFSADYVHKIIKYFWSVSLPLTSYNKPDIFVECSEGTKFKCRESYGYIYPSNPEGGTDSHGYFHKPLLIKQTDVNKSVSYVTKYMLKSAFYDSRMSKGRVLASILYDKNIEKFKEFKRSENKIKCSLGFGHGIIKEVLNSENPCETLYFGADIPCVSNSTKVSIPSNIVRNLTKSNFLKDVTEVQKLNKKGELVLKKKYSYISVDTEFGKQVRNASLKYKVDDFVYNYHKIVDAIFNDADFDNIFNSCADYHNFLQVVKNVDANALAVYKYVYKDRVSTSHLRYYQECPQAFNVLSETSETIFYNKSVNHGVVRKDYVTEVNQLIYYHNTDYVITPYYDTNAFVDDWNDYELPTGRESLKEMVRFAPIFLQMCDDTDIFQFYKNTFNIPDDRRLYYNGYKCFDKFDEILRFIEIYVKKSDYKYETICRQMTLDIDFKHEFEEL